MTITQCYGMSSVGQRGHGENRRGSTKRLLNEALKDKQRCFDRTVPGSKCPDWSSKQQELVDLYDKGNNTSILDT